MKFKFAVAAILACAAFSASAADQVVQITPDLTYDFKGISTPTDGLLSGGNDTITFEGLAPGMYEAVLSFSGNYVKLSSAWLNNEMPLSLVNGSKSASALFEITTSSPLTLSLNGILTNASLAAYSGQITVTAVPEPETYGMLLGGLGILGAVAARRKKQA
ncbi:FxDxF family PEP-CTERM protein [Duganella callida]|uniref:PEP-CTERM sorting domain-containing protein n=1 Tax=Duganella callida TaxID=2561932 RepID=A0A4Y9SXE4_9BURK|nr:FxDxF family PEP-CTERM protein [Duganella callida]TFW31384.1 PEP-CTERM sorting domain-containing protein [Duganella callida]